MKKTSLSAGKYILNSDLFLSKDTLTEQTFFQAYRNWLSLLSSIADPKMYAGWCDHHGQMISNPSFSVHFKAWKAYDHQLHMSFFCVPFIIDIKCRD